MCVGGQVGGCICRQEGEGIKRGMNEKREKIICIIYGEKFVCLSIFISCTVENYQTCSCPL